MIGGLIFLNIGVSTGFINHGGRPVNPPAWGRSQGDTLQPPQVVSRVSPWGTSPRWSWRGKLEDDLRGGRGRPRRIPLRRPSGRRQSSSRENALRRSSGTSASKSPAAVRRKIKPALAGDCGAVEPDDDEPAEVRAGRRGRDRLRFAASPEPLPAPLRVVSACLKRTR